MEGKATYKKHEIIERVVNLNLRVLVQWIALNGYVGIYAVLFFVSIADSTSNTISIGYFFTLLAHTTSMLVNGILYFSSMLFSVCFTLSILVMALISGQDGYAHLAKVANAMSRFSMAVSMVGMVIMLFPKNGDWSVFLQPSFLLSFLFIVTLSAFPARVSYRLGIALAKMLKADLSPVIAIIKQKTSEAIQFGATETLQSRKKNKTQEGTFSWDSLKNGTNG